MEEKIDVIFDMETQDPDDYLTLLLLLDHPRVNLKAVTIIPGSTTQVGLVRRTLEAFGKGELPVGSNNINHPKTCVSPWHERAFGKITPSSDAIPAGKLLAQLCDENTTLVTGAANKNLGAALKFPQFKLGRWVAQGGFAGEGVVPSELQLDKFKGKVTCPTFNFNGDPESVLKAVQDDRIKERYFVSKNVCHGVQYDLEFHELVKNEIDNVSNPRISLQWIYKGMNSWLQKNTGNIPKYIDENSDIKFLRCRLFGLKKESLGVMSCREAFDIAKRENAKISMRPKKSSPPICDLVKETSSKSIGKKLHDPLAACCAIDLSIGTWKKVNIIRKRGEWGSELNDNSTTNIIIQADIARFHEVFLQ